RQSERCRAKGLIGIEAIGSLEIRLRSIVLRELHLEHSASEIQRRGIGMQTDAVVDHINDNLKRLMRRGRGGKINVELNIIWIENDSLPQRVDGLIGFMLILVGC